MSSLTLAKLNAEMKILYATNLLKIWKILYRTKLTEAVCNLPH